MMGREKEVREEAGKDAQESLVQDEKKILVERGKNKGEEI